MRNWSTNASDTMGQLESDLKAIASVGDTGGLDPFRAPCQKLVDDVAAARKIPPAPERVADSWNAMLDGYSAGGTLCVTAVETGDPSLLYESTKHLEAATKASQDVVAEEGNAQ